MLPLGIPSVPPGTLLSVFSGRHPAPAIFRSCSRAAVSVSMALPSSKLGTSCSARVNIISPDVGENDLLVVGPGVLGRIVIERWCQDNPDCQIFGQTMTTNHHEDLLKLGIYPFVREVEFADKFPYVIFCAPPYQTVDYPGDIRHAISNWNGEGCFLFTSSSSIYDCSDNGLCDEDSSVVPSGFSPRTDIFLNAEKAVLENGGCVLRLAGLYKSDRGAHAYWLEKGVSDFRPDHIVNLIHYEDAAFLAVEILRRKLRGRIFMGCDNNPLSRQQIMDAVKESGKFKKKFQGFTGTDGPLGKRMNNMKTLTELGWQPNFPSFWQFLGIAD